MRLEPVMREPGHFRGPAVLLHAGPFSPMYLPEPPNRSKAVSPATIAAADEAAAIEEAAVGFAVTATRWRYGDCRRCWALGGPIRGSAEDSVRRDDSDLVVLWPQPARRGGVCRAFGLGSGCLQSGDDGGAPKAALWIAAKRTELTAIGIMADLVLLMRSRITATEDGRWIIGTAIQIRPMDGRAVRRLRLRTLRQCERSAQDGECNSDGDGLRGHGGAPSYSPARRLQRHAAAIAVFDTWRFDCSRVAVTQLSRTFW
jgi:hypothetical protein